MEVPLCLKILWSLAFCSRIKVQSDKNEHHHSFFIYVCCMLFIQRCGDATRLSSLLSGQHNAPVLQASQLLGDLPHRQAKLGATPAQAMLFEDEAPAHVKHVKKLKNCVKNFWLKPSRSKTRFLASDWIQLCPNRFGEAKHAFRQP